MSESEKEKEGMEEGTEPKKSGFKKIILLVIIILVLGGGAAGGYFFLRSRATTSTDTAKKGTDKKTSSKKDAEDTPATADKSASKKTDPLQNALPQDDDVKKIIELPPFIVNLADTEQARYLRMTVSLGVDAGESASEKPDQLFMTRVRNAILAVLSDKKSDEILSVEGKAKLRKELLEAAQAASENPEVKAIYITDFIVQL